MALRANISKLETSSFEDCQRGVTLKSRVLKQWLKQKGYAQGFVAARLGMSKPKFLSTLFKRQKFNKCEIAELVRLLGVRAVIDVIWFPCLQEKIRIQKYVWEGQLNCNYKSDCPQGFKKPLGKSSSQITEQETGYGENWEQTEAFQDFIFNSDELPSRRIMRRRNG